MVVLPGAVIFYGVSSRYVAANEGGTVDIEPDESKTVDELRAELTGKGERAAQDAVLAELAECVERSTSLEPRRLPGPISPDGYYREEDAEDVVWEPGSEPVLQTQLVDDGSVSVSGDSDLKVTWTDVGYDEEEKVEDTCMRRPFPPLSISPAPDRL
ncbi:hypothetical protein ACWCXS_23485 [Streptomyces sp. NPDC001685]